MYAYKLTILNSNARAGFGMHAKAEQVSKKFKFSWLTLVTQPVVKFKK